VITVYRAVKLTSRYITSRREELLYAMRRDQEDRQRQGLRTMFKPLNHNG
jgi:DNA-binding transcriptional regulator YbjK